MRKVIIIAALLAVLGVPDAARGAARVEEFKAKEVLAEYHQKKEYKWYLQGLMQGIQAGVIYVGKNTDGAQWYCPPKNLRQNGELAFSVLGEYIDKKPEMGDEIVFITLVYALEHTFPCKK